MSDQFKKFVRSVAKYKHVDSDDDTCKKCGDSFEIREDGESTGFCDPCAQSVLINLILKAKEITKLIT